ncbi:hypothetical protein [Loigolactobacillus jiayinensis]|uniref:Uncharacterized protein n=1 Tax=Loigolactobacillus jiayinensis TaxID=2486016 RepID=A0ABW1RGW7_9LACO|nr:hypothetical protein [Loigolactobacillus jiayinensis]
MNDFDIQKRYLQCVTYMITKLKMFDQGFRDYEGRYLQVMETREATTIELIELKANFKRSLINFGSLVDRFQELEAPHKYQRQHQHLIQIYRDYAAAICDMIDAFNVTEYAICHHKQGDGHAQRTRSLTEIKQLLTEEYQLGKTG